MDLGDASQDDFDNEQAEIVNVIKSKERRSGGVGGITFQWNKFNGDLACRVVKEFLRKHLPRHVRLVGPNVYIEGYPTEFNLLVVAENAIPEAFTNAYRDNEVWFVIKVKSHGYMNGEFPSKLLSEFEAIRQHYGHVNCAYLTIFETLHPEEKASISYIRELKKVLEPKYRAFCLSEPATQEVIPGQWRQFVSYITENSSKT